MDGNIRKLGYFFIALFGVLALYLGYLNAVLGPGLSTDPRNRRLAAAEEAVIRGTIYDRRGEVLAEDRETGGVRQRVYPLGKATAHVLGFVSPRYGRTGLESALDGHLLALDGAGRIQAFVDRVLGRQRRGYDVWLSIDGRLQERAWKLMDGRAGAVVALDPRTGAVLALVSSPSFDPASVDAVVRTEAGVQNGKRVEYNITGHDVLKAQTGAAPLLNRAARGIYTPGSVFKIITGAGLLESGPQNYGRIYQCNGGITVEGFELKDFGVHGKIGFNDAVALSCNAAFAGMGLELGGEGLKKAAASFGFQLLEYDRYGRYGGYPVTGGEVPFNPGIMPSNRMDGPELASTAIGQGRVLVSPMQMALLAAGVANGGVVMKPLVIDRVVARNGMMLKRMAPEELYKAVSPETARALTAALEEAVKRGTGTLAALPGTRVAGKTGSAQNPHGRTHAWFVGFAPAAGPRIAVAVVLENAGPGAGLAAPLAGELFREYLK